MEVNTELGTKGQWRWEAKFQVWGAKQQRLTGSATQQRLTGSTTQQRLTGSEHQHWGSHLMLKGGDSLPVSTLPPFPRNLGCHLLPVRSLTANVLAQGPSPRVITVWVREAVDTGRDRGAWPTPAEQMEFLDCTNNPFPAQIQNSGVS